MSSNRILYVAPLINKKIEDRYNRKEYSPAGQNKMRGMIKSMQAADSTVTVVSPVNPNTSDVSFWPKYKTKDGETGANIIVPPIVNVFGLKIVNRIALTLLTTLTMIKLQTHSKSNGVLFYNFRVYTAIPAYFYQVLFRHPAVLQYEDGLFAHKSKPTRVAAMAMNKSIGKRIKGAICVNTQLANQISTDNTTVVRGFPSIGFPDELPDASLEPKKGPVVMFAGSFDEIRGINTFLSVVPLIKDDDISFWISGTGKKTELSRVRENIHELDDSRVEYFGTLPWNEYRKRVVSADILVNLQNPDLQISKYTFPSKLLDFLSAGGKIISTDMSDISSTFNNEIIITGDTNDEIASTISYVVGQVRRNECSGHSCQQWVKKNCDYHTTGQKVNKIFQVSNSRLNDK